MTMTIKISPALEAQLAAEARARSISKSHIVRELLERRYVSRRTRQKTFADVAGHLIGCLDGGPRDLSTNPRHLDGFGE